MSLEFLTMRGTNFCTLLDLPSFALSGRGMVLILGDNQDASKADSNGAGKSLLLELFVWVLWGKTIRGLLADDVVNDVVLRNCFGEVVFRAGGHTYTVRRYRCHDVTKGDKTVNQKENDLVLLRDGIPHATEGKMADTQESLNQLLGITFPIFEAMMPGTGIRAASMGDAGIKALLESILQTEVYAAAEKITKARLKKAQERLAKKQTAQENSEGSIARLEEDISWNENLLATFNENRQKRIDKANEEKNGVLSLIDLLGVEVSEYWLALAKLSTEDQHQEVVKRGTDLAEELRKHEDEVRVALSGLREEWNRVQPLQDRLHTDEVRIETMGPSCSECLQSVDDSYRVTQLAEIVEQRAPLQQLLLDNEEKQAKINQVSYRVVQEFNKRISETSAAIDKSQADIKSRADINHEIKSLEAQAQLQADRLPKLQEATQEGMEEVQHTEGRIAELQEQLQEAQEAVGESQEEIKDIQKLVRALEFWAHGYSTKGIRSHVLKSVTPVLNEITRKNCETLTGAEMSIVFNTQTTIGSGEVREKFDIQVSQAHGGNSYKKNSEGEKQRADVIIAMSLADLAAMRTSFPFRFLDEPFVRVDDSGTEAIISLLRQYEETYDTIFVVTHQEQVKSMFAAPLTMVKSGGVSRLEGDTDDAEDTTG